ncbi:MAG: tagaturonate epimerase family protein [Desulfuromonadales bacterium]
MRIEKYSMGTGDRFGLQGKAQLSAVMQAKTQGVDLAIVWNKSHREHKIVNTSPQAVRKEADQAVANLGWRGQYLVDADHIGLGNVDLFLDSSDFFTLDVADFIGKKADQESLQAFIGKHSHLLGELKLPGIDRPLSISRDLLQSVAEKYLYAVQEAGKIYRHILKNKGDGNFITEVSMDETADPQTPVEMLLILAAIADEKIPAQTIAPKFTGRFNKGVDYLGDVVQFRKEFEADLCVIKYAVKTFGLPENLKLSVHSGSDKFTIYRPIRELIGKHDAGIHVKTAGTTWLEELIGLAEAGGEGLEIAKQIYSSSYDRFDELCTPYASVIDIDRKALPTPETLNNWTSTQYVEALRHDQSCPAYNVNLRQLLHVGYKVAAEMGETYLHALRKYHVVVSRNVSENLLERHIRPLFL